LLRKSTDARGRHGDGIAKLSYEWNGAAKEDPREDLRCYGKALVRPDK